MTTHSTARVCGLVLATSLISTSASGQEVKLSDLEGIAVEADINRDQVNRRDGRTIPVKIHQRWTFSVDADKTIEFTVRTTSRGPRGTRKDAPQSGTFTLDESREVASRGGGDAVWKFADGTLTFIRTFQAGARRVDFAFARGRHGLTCTANFAFARESEGGAILMDSRFGGGQMTIVSTKQVSSSCKVSKKN